VVDYTVPGFQIMVAAVTEMSTNLVEKESDSDLSSSLQQLNNSCYECKLPNGDRVLPHMGNDGNFNAIVELGVIRKDTLHNRFLQLTAYFQGNETL
jgi:hypothetical protein